jgi:hypothetical protein
MKIQTRGARYHRLKKKYQKNIDRFFDLYEENFFKEGGEAANELVRQKMARSLDLLDNLVKLTRYFLYEGGSKYYVGKQSSSFKKKFMEMVIEMQKRRDESGVKTVVTLPKT